MLPILHIAAKDLLQMLRDRKTFLFLLIMPIAFTLMFGFAFNNTSQGSEDTRLPVGLLNQDPASPLSQELQTLLSASNVIRIEPQESGAKAGAEADAAAAAVAELEKAVTEKKLAAAVIIPQGYGDSLASGAPIKLVVLTDPSTTAALSAQTEISVAASRMNRAVRTAQVLAPSDPAAFETALKGALAAWQNPPVRMAVTQNESVVTESVPTGSVPTASEDSNDASSRFAHSSPGMILQFAIAGLLTCAQVIVSERKNRCLQRLLTTATNRAQILLGHYLAIFLLIFGQFAVLIIFGELVLNLTYFSQPLATLLVAVTAAMCIAALGLLIGALARAEEHAITLSLICMFLLAGLGGAWVPLEFTGEVFRAVGHLSPLAWAMDGFQNVLIRGLGVSAALLPAAALLGYTALFFGLANWRFKFE